MLFNAPIAALLALVPSALATITITGPSADAYWVEGTSNQITWSYSQGDPNPISIIVTNPNNTYLNGPFSIAEHVDLSKESFTVTNVTLNVHPGYVVNFVNGTNATQVYAQSGTFDVKSPGTAKANQTTPAGAPGATATSPSKNGTATSSGATGSATSGSSSDARGRYAAGVVPMIVASVLFGAVGAVVTL